MSGYGRTRLFYAFCVLSVVGRAFCDDYIATGKSHTFKPNFKGKITTFNWKFKGDGQDAVRLADWDPKNKVHWYSHKDRASLSPESGELTINDMKKEDSGVYTVEFEMNDVLDLLNFKLVVMDALSKPQVTCEGKLDKTEYLVCSVDRGDNAVFTWMGPDNNVVGNRISISEEQSKDSIFFCTVENKVSKNNTEWKLAQCYKVPDKPTALIAWIIPVVIIILVCVIGVLIWKFRAAIFKRNRPENKSNAAPEEGKMLQGNDTNTSKNTPNSERPNVNNSIALVQDNEVQGN